MSAANLIPLRRLAGGPAGVQVYGALRDAIIAAELEPGRQLSENELASQLGVSRTPVREAVARLRDDRLVEIVPQLGTFVSRVSVSAVNDAQFIRESLECAAVRLAAERARGADIDRLQELLVAQARAGDAGAGEHFLELDDEFHGTLCELSGHAIAWAIVQRANGHLNRVRRLSVPQPRYMAEMVAEHREVLAAVASGEPDGAETALRHHLRMVLSGLHTIRSEHPDYFEDA